MAKNSRMSKLSEKDDECIFSWKLFTAWDYMIGNSEAAHNRVASVVMGFKEALLEEAEKKREETNWKITTARVFVNIVILGLFTCSGGSVVYLVKRSTEAESQLSFWRRNELTIVMSLISLVFPMLFDAMGYFERYHPRKQLRIQLARIMALNLLNLYSLIISQFDKIHGMSGEMTGYFNNLTSHKSLDVLEGDPFERPPNIPIDKDVVYCFRKCYKNTTKMSKPLVIASLILNSSFLTQENGYSYSSASKNPSTVAFHSTVSTGNSSLFLEENSGDDYPNYNEYFAQDGETESSKTIEINSTISSNYSFFTEYSSLSPEDEIEMNSTIWSTTVDQENISSLPSSIPPKISSIEPNEEDERDKYTDYLTYIISSMGGKISDTDPFNVAEGSSDLPIFNTTTSFTTEETNSSSSSYEDSTHEVEESSKTITTRQTTSNHRYYITDEEEPESIYSTKSYSDSTTEKSCMVPQESSEGEALCEWVCEEEKPINMTEVGYLIRKMNNTDRKKLRALCWETMFGQDLIKLTVMDLIMTFLSTMAVDFFRAVFVRVMNNCWCWDLEKVFPKYSDFKVAENILHLVNNQGMIWMGLFFSPGLAVVNVVKLFVLMYLRAWTVLTCNVPPEVIFRASKSNNFYYALLLMMLFLCTLPVGYAMVVIEPSWYCGPFSGYKRMYTILTSTISKIIPRSFDNALQYAVSPGTIIPLLVLMILFIYYLTSLSSSLREANAELKLQLRRERTEERRKVFQLVDRRRRVGSAGSDPNNPFNKWKKLLSTFPAGKSVEDSGKLESFDQSQSESVKGDFFSKLIKKALGKTSYTDNNNQNRDDASDLDQQDSLPHDVNKNSDSTDVVIPKRRTSSTTSRNLRQLVAILSTNKDKEGVEDISTSSHIDLIKEENSNTTKSEDSKRQESVSSNWSDNIPVITISNIEHADSKNGQQNVKLVVDTDLMKNSSGIPGKDKFKPRVKYALTKQSTEIDEESIRHFHKDIMKQRSQTLVHDTFMEENRTISLERIKSKVDSKKGLENSKYSPRKEQSKSSSGDSNDQSLERKDSVFY